MQTASPTRTIFRLWLVLALVIGPFLVVPLFAGSVLHDNQRLLQISCVLLALVAIGGQLLRGTPLPVLLPWRIAFPLGLFFLLGFASSAVAYSPRHAFFEWANFLLLLGCAWLIAAEVAAEGEPLLDRLLLFAGLACALYLLLALAMYLVMLKAHAQASPFQLTPGYETYRIFNHVQTITLPLLGLLAARMPEPGRRRFWWGVTALWWMLLFVSVGRGTLVGMLLGLAIAWVAMPRVAAAWCRAMLMAALAGLLAYLLLYVAVPVALGLQPYGLLFTTVERSVAVPASGRRELWWRALDMIAAHPWLGAGPAHFAHYPGVPPLEAAGHPHDWVLQIGSEWGLPALALLLGVLVHLLWRLWQLRREVGPGQQATLAAWVVGAWAILIDGLVSGLIVMPTSQLWLAFYLGCCWGWCLAQGPSIRLVRPRHSPWRQALALVVALGLSYALVQGVWPDLQARIGPQEVAITGGPRILFNGKF